MNTLRLLEEPLTYRQVEEKVEDFLPNSRTGLKLILAVLMSALYENAVLLWLLIVGAPSSGKTDLIKLIKDVPFTFFLDTMTQNAFVSGERHSEKEPVYDLLSQLNKQCLAIKDWTSIFALDEKATKKLLGEFVNIYDKEFNKFSSRRGKIDYSYEFSHLGCITPATLNKHINYLNIIGPRFLFYMMPELTKEQEDKNFEMILSERDGVRQMKEKVARLYVSSYINQLSKHDINTVNYLSNEAQVYIRIAAKLISTCRGIVILQSSSFKNQDGEEFKYYDIQGIQIEQPWRATHQLKELAKYIAFVSGHDQIGLEEFEIIKEIVISSMPADRSQALREMIKLGGNTTATKLTSLSNKSRKTNSRLLEELKAIGVLEKLPGSGQVAADYIINPEFKDFLLLNPTEFLSLNHDNSGTETRDDILINQHEELDDRTAKLKELFVQLKIGYEYCQKNQNYPKRIEKMAKRVEPIYKELESLGVSRDFSQALFYFGPLVTNKLTSQFNDIDPD